MLTSKQFKEFRRKLGLTQKELAFFAGVCEDYISQIERDIEPVSERIVKVMLSLAAVLE